MGLRALLESAGPDRQDARQLSHRLRAGAAHQRRRPHEPRRTSRRGCCSPRDEGALGRGARRSPSSSTTRTRSARRKRRRSSPRRASWSRPTPTSAPTTCSWWRGRAGIAASSASSRRSWSTLPQAGDRAVDRRRRDARARAAASRRSTCSARSKAAPICSAATAATGRRPACRSSAAGSPSSGPASPASPTSRLEPDDLVPRLRIDARAAAAGLDRRGGRRASRRWRRSAWPTRGRCSRRATSRW